SRIAAPSVSADCGTSSKVKLTTGVVVGMSMRGPGSRSSIRFVMRPARESMLGKRLGIGGSPVRGSEGRGSRREQAGRTLQAQPEHGEQQAEPQRAAAGIENALD